MPMYVCMHVDVYNCMDGFFGWRAYISTMKKSKAVEELKSEAFGLLERQAPVERRRRACACFVRSLVGLLSFLPLEREELLEVPPSAELVGREDEVLIGLKLFLVDLLLQLVELRRRQRSPLPLEPLKPLLVHGSGQARQGVHEEKVHSNYVRMVTAALQREDRRRESERD